MPSREPHRAGPEVHVSTSHSNPRRSLVLDGYEHQQLCSEVRTHGILGPQAEIVAESLQAADMHRLTSFRFFQDCLFDRL
jgi:hypothetical protein